MPHSILHTTFLNFLRSRHLVVTVNERRWLVVGIALFKVLPQILPFVEREVDNEYKRRMRSNNIRRQRGRHRLRQLPSGVSLNYENINDNDTRFPKLPNNGWNYNSFDCRVLSHIDFAKLFLENFMTKRFRAFDKHCDISVILSLLGRLPVFSAAVQRAAGSVRDARNDWAHCVFDEWNDMKFQQVFADIVCLVNELGLQAADKEKVLKDLKDWQQKGKGTTDSHKKL